MANCKSCLNSYASQAIGQKQIEIVCCNPDSGISLCPEGDHELACYQYEPGSLDEPAKTEW